MIEREAVRRHIVAKLRRPGESVTDDVVLRDLVAESFVLIELVIDLQEEFGVRLAQQDLEGVSTAGHLIDLIASRG
jgi:acyl carrier protein